VNHVTASVLTKHPFFKHGLYPKTFTLHGVTRTLVGQTHSVHKEGKQQCRSQQGNLIVPSLYNCIQNHTTYSKRLQ